MSEEKLSWDEFWAKLTPSISRRVGIEVVELNKLALITKYQNQERKEGKEEVSEEGGAAFCECGEGSRVDWAMAINDNDPINFDSAIDYTDLYNNDNSSEATPLAAALTSSFKSQSSAGDSHQQHSSTANTSPHINAGPAAASVTATALTTLTSAIVNNYSNHNSRNHKHLRQNLNFNNSLSYHNSSNQSSPTLSLLKSLSHHTTNGSGGSDQIFNSNFSNNMNDSAKIPLESGSNFMLLLEDFGEYFYNYNNGSDYQNTTISIYPSNCSLPNSNCTENIAEEARKSER